MISVVIGLPKQINPRNLKTKITGSQFEKFKHLADIKLNIKYTLNWGRRWMALASHLDIGGKRLRDLTKQIFHEGESK